MKELFGQFERQAIDANYPFSFSKTDGNTRYFYSQTQAMFDGWLLHYRSSNGVANNDFKLTAAEALFDDAEIRKECADRQPSCRERLQ